METDISEIKESLKSWYFNRSDNGIMPVYDARNHVIDLDLLDEESLRYYYEYAKQKSMKIPISCETGLCCKKSIECIHKYEYFGCDGCSVKIAYDIEHPKYNNELDGVIRKRRSKK